LPFFGTDRGKKKTPLGPGVTKKRNFPTGGNEKKNSSEGDAPRNRAQPGLPPSKGRKALVEHEIREGRKGFLVLKKGFPQKKYKEHLKRGGKKGRACKKRQEKRKRSFFVGWSNFNQKAGKNAKQKTECLIKKKKKGGTLDTNRRRGASQKGGKKKKKEDAEVGAGRF